MLAKKKESKLKHRIDEYYVYCIVHGYSFVAAVCLTARGERPVNTIPRAQFLVQS
jgi:hypothetical protein